MDNQILFLIIGAIIWVLQMVIKSRSKSDKQAKGTRVNNQSSSQQDDSRFYNVLNDFSDKLKREMEVPVSVVPQVEKEVTTNDVVKTPQKPKVVVVKRKSSITPNLKSPKALKEALIASEILKTKF